MSDEKKPFTVTDRRHFTREGEVREDAPPPSPEPKAPSRPPAAAEARAAQPGRVITEAGRAPDPAHARAEASYRQVSGARAAEPDEGGLDFVGLLLSLGSQASMMLGLGGPPGAPAAPPDLAGARSIINLLEILNDKTEGRRTAEEDEVLDSLLYELRMSYVAQARKGGP
jgi:hypothetical protein